MRRILSTVLVGCGALGLGLGLAGAGLGADATAAYAEAGKKVCTITDERMRELSGLIATADGFIVINDGSEDESRERVFLLDEKCRLRKAVAYGGNGPFDPEDLALSPDGETVWIADTGDNGSERRSTVALWSMPVDGSARPVIHRLAYPDEKRRDAEALLIGDDNVPLIITKTTGKAEIFRPAGKLRKNNTEGVPLEKAGEFSLPKSTTSNRFAAAGRLTITGAGRSPDGKRIAVRTYADAFEWDVQDGDLVKTLTTGTPRMTPLEDPFGEAIAYSTDGKYFLTVSDVAALDEQIDVTILRYTPATVAAAATEPAERDAAGSGGSWTDSLTLDDVTYLIGAVGVLGTLLVALGVFGILRARRRPDDGSGTGGAGDDDTGPRAGRARPGGGDPAVGRPPARDERDRGWHQGPEGYGQGYRADRPADDLEPAGGRGRGAVYGGRPSGGVYGGPPAPDRGAPVGRPRPAAGVYGGRPSGGVYGGPPAPDRGVPAGRPRPDGAPAGRPRSGGGGVYGGQPRDGGGGVYGAGAPPAPRGGRPGPDQQPWTGSGQRGPGVRGGGPYEPSRQRPGWPDDDYR